MAQWIRNNLVLVAGIALPVLLVAAFLLMQSIPGVAPPPPKFDFVAAGYYYAPNSPQSFSLSFEVQDGRLHGIATPRADSSRRDAMRVNLFRYDARENRFSDIEWTLPEGLEALDEALRFEIDGTASLELDPSARSPDGYRLEWTGYRHQGLLGDLFGFGHRPSQWCLKQGDKVFELPVFEPLRFYSSDQLEFLGWVTAGTGEP